VILTHCHCQWYKFITGRYKLAEVDLQRALELKPDFEDARLNLNQVHSDLQSGHQFNVTTQNV